MGQPRILYDDGNLRLSEQGKTFVLEYLIESEVDFCESFNCKICALRALLVAVIELEGRCDHMLSIRLNDTDDIQYAAGGRN